MFKRLLRFQPSLMEHNAIISSNLFVLLQPSVCARLSLAPTSEDKKEWKYSCRMILRCCDLTRIRRTDYITKSVNRSGLVDSVYNLLAGCQVTACSLLKKHIELEVPCALTPCEENLHLWPVLYPLRLLIISLKSLSKQFSWYWACFPTKACSVICL